MVVGGVNKCIKYALFLFNFAFVVIGIVLVAVGVSTQNGFTKYLHIVDTGAFAAPPKLCIAIGVIMFLIAFLGCCGAWMENHAMTMAYSVLVGLILILQLGVGISAFLLEDDVENLVRSGLTKTLNSYNNETAPEFNEIRKSWNLVQSELHCCGVNNYTDWAAAAKHNPPINDTMTPTSCCNDGMVKDCAKPVIDGMDEKDASKYIYTEGCLEKGIKDIAISHIGAIGIGLAAVELLGVICACLLARSIRFSYETV